MTLTAENYYSRGAAKAYYSASQVKGFIECPAAVMAALRGEYERKKTPALLVGGFIDAHFSGEEEQFRAENPQIFTKTGTLRSDYVKAEDIIERIERDELAVRLLSGETQKIVTGEIAGFPFKAKLDSWLDKDKAQAIARDFPGMDALTFADGAIIDLKVMKDFDALYREGEGRLHFVEYWRYDLQMAIYQELMRQETGKRVPCYILAATKQDPPDLALVQIGQDQLDFCMARLKEGLPEMDAIKRGEDEPDGCTRCAWCRQAKKLTGPTMEGTLMF